MTALLQAETPTAVASEDDFLALIDSHFPREHGHVVLGRGDDCAILTMPDALCLSTDLFLEDVHFRRGYFTPAEIGHKALAVNVSDIAAMGGDPLGFSLGLMVPPGLPREFWDALFTGMAAHAAAHGLALTGGDLSRAPLLGFSVTIWGRPFPGRPLLRRGPVQPGDRLVVLGPSGQLGLARQGLRLLEAHDREALADWPACTAAHLMPEPQVAAGRTLAAVQGVHGCMDLSDGLARDLPRLLTFGQAPGLVPGARLELDASMLHPELLAACAAAGLDPVAEAFLGGEDYALLAAVDPAAMPALRHAAAALPAALLDLGEVTAAPGVMLNNTPMTGQGFDHFSKR
ncbi:thiamine-phosphate kinase [Megalodesulfovibrio gigas]|uniref:thiamine-phosphate kinase n=1 Tax=Megalodesulfovibrio gigas TaxID=879 RepID=UPI000421D784|nr:thiamine-phosphate kinase [Megalodesulfovibrio gigas]